MICNHCPILKRQIQGAIFGSPSGTVMRSASQSFRVALHESGEKAERSGLRTDRT